MGWLACAGLLTGLFAAPALAAERGNAADFNGVWETEVPEVNAHYTMTLTVQGKRVTGYFTNKEAGQFNGTITGSVDPSKDGTAGGGRMEYVYLQPEVGAKGSGYFIVADDGTMAGFVQGEGDNTKYVWQGTRVSDGTSAERGNAADFTGTWATTLPDVGASYTLALEVKGTSVIGVFSGKDGQYDGTLKGKVDPSKDGTAGGGRMEYTYRQPAIDATGGGYFIVSDEGTIAGFTYSDDSKNDKYVWQGTLLSKKIPTIPEDGEDGGDDPDPDPQGGTVRITEAVTGYDKEGGGPDKCYLNEGDEAELLGVGTKDDTWKHLKGDDICGGDDFWLYDDGKLEEL